MINKNKRFFLVYIFLILFIIQSVYSQAPPQTPPASQQDAIGCCTNPGAGALTCSTDRLVKRDAECCPKPESSFVSYYKSQQNPNGPSNYAECSGNFFFQNKGCADTSISACSVGCCCSDAGSSIKPESQCQGSGLRYFRGQTDCNEACRVTQCSDGIDNDHNGCADLRDTGCSSSDDNSESGGTCIGTETLCNDPSYVPKLTNFQINPVKGEKKLLLTWTDDCKVNIAFYEISRCEGIKCTNFVLIGTINSNSFEDASDELAFGKTYNYKVEAHYTLQAAIPAIINTGTLGDKECIERGASTSFCKDNTPYFCNKDNKLLAAGAKCDKQKICAVINNKASCIDKPKCSDKESSPFGFFSDTTKCEKNRYCFFDKSYSIVDSCYGCDSSMSCYDYKSEATCTRDNCKVGNCKWKNQADQIGIGVCTSTTKSNCQWCDKKGTESMENAKSYNELFDLCTQDKSNVLSEGKFKCYFKDGTSGDCGSTTCADYNAEQCSNTPIAHDQDNKITNPSSDPCGIQVCQNINGACVKNADGDENPDCENTECEKDYFPPNTNLIPLKKKSLVDTIIIQIFDKIIFDGSAALTTSADYITYLCVEPCGASGHPFPASTKSRKLVVSGLNVYDSDNGNKLLSLSEGQNSIKYYSQDASKNIGRVKSIPLEAYSKADPPKVQSVEITNAEKFNDILITNANQPTVTVNFFEPAAITYARLIGDSGFVMPLSFGNNLGTAQKTAIQQPLKDGIYKLEINAKNGKNIFMDDLFSAKFIIDTVKPKINITPSNGNVLDSSSVDITLAFDEEVSLDSVILNSVIVQEPFTTSDNKIFTTKINMPDGNKILEVSASDHAKNKASGSSSFVVDAFPTRINLTSPKFGVAPDYTFSLAVETDNNAECGYNLDEDLDFDFTTRFDSTGGVAHSTKNFNEIIGPDNGIHKLYVKCSDKKYGITSKIFDLSVDTTPPEIKTAFAFPNPIVEKPITTKLTVETDEPSICKYSTNAQDSLQSMKDKFDNYNNNAFIAINRQNISLQKDGEYTYYVACKNKAGLNSGPAPITFIANLAGSLVIISHTPGFFNTTQAVLAIETNKKTQCKYSETDKTAQSGILFGALGYAHTVNLSLPGGNHTFYIVCRDPSKQQWSGIFLQNFTIDTTSPVMLYVNDTSIEIFPAEKTCYTDKLRVKYLGEDLESGIREYFYTILRNNQPIIDTVKTFTGGEWTWVENLNLQDNSVYFFSVRAKNFAGLTSSNKTSDGITVDTSLCGPGKRCGDGTINLAGEECDGSTFGIITSCLNYTNFIGGTLGCTPANSGSPCKLDTSGCTRLPACGNGQIDPGEMCDGTKFGYIDSCSKFSDSFAGGILKCTSSCQLDTSGCTEKPKCGNGFIDSGESCDGNNLGPLSGKCTDYNPSTFTDGTLACTGCRIDTSGCKGISTGTCGDGLIKIGESCDGNAFGQIKSCTDFNNTFVGGTLGCTATTCQLNTTGCTEKPKCGNGFIDLGETCDNNNIIPSSKKCLDYSSDYGNGNLKCTNCKLDTNDCTQAPTCGNSRIDSGELCDGSIFNITNLNCNSYSSTFVNGTLTCSNCRISTNNCTSNVTVTPVITCNNRGTCNVNEACSDNSECASRFCFSGKCKEQTCSDGIKNQNEGDVDCGGPCSAKCGFGKSCKISSDCQSFFCSFGTCKETETCSNAKLDASEADVDCGGACPNKCAEGTSCNGDSDCQTDLKCISAQCKKITIENQGQKCNVDNLTDSDCDGLPDEWEIQNGLNPNDPNDANIDTDGDGLTNREEFELQKTFGKPSDPRKNDTDNDGFTDKQEVDKGTNPTDPLSFPKSNFTKILLFVLGAVVLISGFGYLAYVTIEKRKENEFETPRQKPVFRPAPQVQQQMRRPVFMPKPDLRIGESQIKDSLKSKEMQKDIERKKLFTSFGTQKPEIKEQKQESKIIQTEKSKQEKPHKKQAKAKVHQAKKPKEDVFVKLKEIAQEKKKKASGKNVK